MGYLRDLAYLLKNRCNYAAHYTRKENFRVNIYKSQLMNTFGVLWKGKIKITSNQSPNLCIG